MIIAILVSLGLGFVLGFVVAMRLIENGSR
jgi:hypothetical protein